MFTNGRYNNIEMISGRNYYFFFLATLFDRQQAISIHASGKGWVEEVLFQKLEGGRVEGGERTCTFLDLGREEVVRGMDGWRPLCTEFWIVCVCECVYSIWEERFGKSNTYLLYNNYNNCLAF